MSKQSLGGRLMDVATLMSSGLGPIVPSLGLIFAPAFKVNTDERAGSLLQQVSTLRNKFDIIVGNMISSESFPCPNPAEWRSNFSREKMEVLILQIATAIAYWREGDAIEPLIAKVWECFSEGLQISESDTYASAATLNNQAVLLNNFDIFKNLFVEYGYVSEFAIEEPDVELEKKVREAMIRYPGPSMPA